MTDSDSRAASPFDPDVLQAWIEESRRRLDALKSGDDPGISLEEFLREGAE